jgi:hypothetical protein
MHFSKPSDVVLGGNNLKKDSFILFSVFICLAGLAVFNLFRSMDLKPYDFLVKEYRNEESIMKPFRMIEQVNLDEDESLIFYINEKGNLACAIIEKGFFTYKIMNTSSESSFVRNIQTADACFSAYEKGQAWLCWGIIRNERIQKILVNGEEAAIIENSIPIFYLVGQGNKAPDELTYLYYDQYGQPVD